MEGIDHRDLPLREVEGLIEYIFPKVVTWRRDFHRFPELSFEERETSEYISRCLDEMGIPYENKIGGFGIKAVIEGVSGSKVIALRADMDALPIQELSEHAYKSSHEGKMHACGHDVHMANLLGTAWILQKLKDRWPGKVVLIFQPAEERLPGGASLMIRDGILDNPKPDAILGLHVYPQLVAGHVGLKPGRYMASADEIYIKVKGKGGHGALPQLAVDPILVSSHLVIALQSLISRSKDPISPGVLTIGKIVSKGGSTNIIPDEVYMEGTFRAMDEQWRTQAHHIIQRLVHQIAEAMGALVDLEIKKGYPVLYNDPQLSSIVHSSLQKALGSEYVHNLDERMTAEDFAWYSHQIPACFYRLGTAAADGSRAHSLHTPYFDIDESALKIGMKTMCIASLSFLQD